MFLNVLVSRFPFLVFLLVVTPRCRREKAWGASELSPRGLHFQFLLQYKKRLLLRCIHHFKSDLIDNMDHMRISGTKPSSVILSQTVKFKKLKNDDQKLPKQAVNNDKTCKCK